MKKLQVFNLWILNEVMNSIRAEFKCNFMPSNLASFSLIEPVLVVRWSQGVKVHSTWRFLWCWTARNFLTSDSCQEVMEVNILHGGKLILVSQKSSLNQNTLECLFAICNFLFCNFQVFCAWFYKIRLIHVHVEVNKDLIVEDKISLVPSAIDLMTKNCFVSFSVSKQNLYFRSHFSCKASVHPV